MCSTSCGPSISSSRCTGASIDAITTLRRRRQLATPVTLRPMFDADEAMKELGGPAYLAQLTGNPARA